MRKLMLGLALGALVACGGGTSVTGPDAPTTEAPAPVAVVATPVPQPVANPTPAADHDASVRGGFYSVTNTTGIAQFYCAAAFGVLPGGAQGAGTNLYQDQGVRNNRDVFSGQAPKKAACQYKQIQVDLTQSKDCKNFDWTNVLAAEVYSNPDYVEDTKKVLVSEGEAGEWTAYSEYGPWSSWSQEGCGSRTRTRTKTRDWFKVEKFECSGEVVKTKIRTETQTDTQTETKDCCKYPQPSFTITINDPLYTPYSPAVPATPAYYYYQYSNSGNSSKDACSFYGGTWLGNYSGQNNYNHVCRFTSDKGATVGVLTVGTKVETTPAVAAKAAVQEALGPITTTATFSGAGTWLLRMNATGYTDGQKGQKEEILTCNSAPKTISVTYDWLNHGAEEWYGNLRLNGNVVATSAVRNNPSN